MARNENIFYGFSSFSDVKRKGGQTIVQSNDCYIWDDEGKKYIDGFAGLQVVNIGHGREEVVEKIHSQAKELVYWQTFHGFSSLPIQELARKIASITPGDLNYSHFVNSGSEGNDTALKIARAYFKKQGSLKHKIIYRNNAYHGMNMGAVSVCGFSKFRAPYEPLLPGMVRIPNCHCYNCPVGKVYASCNIDCALALEKAIIEEGPDTVAAFIADPVQGSISGYVAPVKEYFPLIKEICDKYNILFIDDEVITGFGRTGKMFGIEHHNVVPDMMVTAKGLSSGYQPIGAVVLSEKIVDVLGDSMFTHGYTYGGHPLAAAASLANINIIERENLVENSAQIGKYIGEKLNKILDYQVVGEIRANGMMIAVEFDNNRAWPPEFVARIVELAYNNGLFIRHNSLANSLIICPPLTMTKEIADEMVSIIDYSLTQVAGEFGYKL